MAMSIEEVARWADVYNNVENGHYSKRKLIKIGKLNLNLSLNDDISEV